MLKFAVMKRKQHVSHAKLFTWAAPVVIAAILLAIASEAGAQNRDKQRRAQVDSMLAARYYRNGGIDTMYLQRPTSKWTITAKANVSGMKIETEGRENGKHFNSEMKAERKATISVGVSYVGLSVSLSLNPAKLAGKYHDYEFNFRSYGKRFSYPAAFSQNYIQRRSAGSFFLTISAQGQHAELDGEQNSDLKMTNIGIGGGYGYNYVPSKGWLLHISAQPTFIVYSKTSLTFNDTSVPLHYHFPEVIITGRSAVVKLI